MNGSRNTVLENTRAFREKVRKNGFCAGVEITLNDAQVTEILSTCGFDFFWFDTEHTAMNIETLRAHVSVCRSRGFFSMVRVPWNDPVLIKPVLDLGANGIIVPNVKDADEAETAVRSCQYPPRGVRGFGPRQAANWGRISAVDYARDAEESIFTVIQIESREGVANLDSILQVPGLDSICLGPSDLSASMGLIGQVDHPEVKQAVSTIMEKTLKSEKILGCPGVVANNPGLAADYIRRGVHWISLGADVALLSACGDKALDDLAMNLGEDGT